MAQSAPPECGSWTARILSRLARLCMLGQIPTSTTHHSMDSTGALATGLRDRYVLERELGQGGMAVVYLAQDLTHDRPVALKVLNPELAAVVGPDRFLREIRITSKLDHPNILGLMDSGVAGGLPWYSMPFVEGESLRGRLHRVGGQMPFAEVILLGRQIAGALDYAHAAGIVHRDIKPENILLSGDHVWVADFGIARIVLGDVELPITSKSLVLGTPHYMSPEQARGGGTPVDSRSDIYSLGCVLYELLAGHPPFTGPTREAVLARHALDPVPPIATVRPTVGPAVQAVLETALAKSPADRFTTASQAVAALESALAQPRRPRRRMPMVGSLLGAAAAVLGVLWLRSAEKVLDAHRVVVVPLEVRGDVTLSGDDAAIAMADALNTTDTLIADVVASGLANVGSRPSDSLLRRLGRNRHARYVITGRLLGGEPLRSELVVHDLVTGSALFREIVVSGNPDAFSLAGRLANAVLPDLIRPGGAMVDEGRLSASVPALSAYLQGERAYRRGDYLRADSLYGITVARDSSFAWAALRGAQAANWLTERTRAAAFLEVALRKVDSLPPRYAAFARGLSAYGSGQADSAVAEFRRALSIDHRWAEAHTALGEVYQHYVPSGGYPFETARAAFDSALIYDSAFAAPLFHAAQHAVWRGDRPRADSLLQRLSSTAPNSSEERRQLELARGCLDGTSTAERWSAAARQSVSAAAQAATWLVVGGLRFPQCARDGLEAVIANEEADWQWHFYATLELAAIDAALGEVDDLRRRLLALGTSGDVATIFLATSGLPIDDLADAASNRLRELTDPDASPLGPWAVGTWAIERRDTATAKASLETLARLDRRGDRRLHHLLDESLRARLSLLRGDTTGAIQALSRLSPATDQRTLRWNPWEALPWERFQLAQLLAARGRLAEAAALASAFDSPASFGFVPWLPASLRFRERIERSLGDARYANELRNRYVTLMKGSAPQQPSNH
jgi:tetratricopeptide (TPR) repeat protein